MRTLMEMLATYPPRTLDMQRLGDYAKMAKNRIEDGEMCVEVAVDISGERQAEMRAEGERRIEDGRAASALIEAEFQRRRDLIAGARSFEPRTKVRIVQELEDWNMGVAAQPPVGIEGTVAVLGAYDAKHLPEGKVPVSLRLSDLGYLDCGKERKVFYIWAWALDDVKPEAELDAETPSP